MVSQRRVVMECCERAMGAGVRAGMDLVHARALLPGESLVRACEPMRDTERLKALAAWCNRFAPIVGVDDSTEPEDAAGVSAAGAGRGLLLDISGCQRLYTDERVFMRRVSRALRRMGVRCRLAAGPTIGSAWALAHDGPIDGMVLAEGSAQAIGEAVGPLPGASLRLDGHTVAGLEKLGVHTVAQVLALPRRMLRARFGPGLARRIDQLLGEAIEHIEPVRPSPPPGVHREFDGPVTQIEAVEETVRGLLEQLCRRLDELCLGARLVEVRLERAGAAPTVLHAALSRAARCPRHLWSLLRDRVEKVHMGFGVERIDVVAVRSGRTRVVQAGLDGERVGAGGAGGTEAGASQALGEFLDTLVARLGPDGVARPLPAPSHLPELAWRTVPAMTPVPRDAHLAPVVASPRPVVLLANPEPARVMALVPDGPPVRVTWRGREHTVARAAGPERIGECWWRGGRRGSRELGGERASQWSAQCRDYFRVLTEEGLCLWMLRRDGGEWFVHGVWS